MAKTQKYINNQIYMKGFNFNAIVGTTEVDSISLGGNARFLYGINILMTAASVADEDTFSMVLNEETIVDKANWKIFYPGLNSNKVDQFFPLPRPLFGNDSLLITWNGVTGAKTVYPIFYLSTVDNRTQK